MNKNKGGATEAEVESYLVKGTHPDPDQKLDSEKLKDASNGATKNKPKPGDGTQTVKAPSVNNYGASQKPQEEFIDQKSSKK